MAATETQPVVAVNKLSDPAGGRASLDPWAWQFCDCLGVAVVCCECVPIGQMFDTHVKKGWGKLIIAAYTAVMILVGVLAIVWLATWSYGIYAAALALGLIAHTVLMICNILVRIKIRERNGIPTAFAGDPCVEDCLCLLCCCPFAQCQVARQQWKDPKKYVFISEDGGSAV